MQDKPFCKGIFLALFWAVSFFYWTAPTQANEPTSPFHPSQGGSCIEVGPAVISDDYCGCTYGHVYYQGESVADTKVTLTFNNQSIITYTNGLTNEFSLSGHLLEAKRNDIMTLTTEYAGQTATRTFRAWPDDAVQKVDLILDPGQWEHWISDSYTSTLAALDSQTALAGGLDGLLQIYLATGQQTEFTLPWQEERVRDVAVDSQARIWVSGNGGLAIYDNDEWETPTIPLSEPIHRLAITPDGSQAWASDNDIQGNLMFFNGTDWVQQEPIGDYVADLVLDADQTLWVATWQSGLIAIDQDGQRTAYTTEDGLPHNSIYNLLIAPKPMQEPEQEATDVLWFGTRSVANSDNPAGDSLGFYDFATQEWVTYNAGIPGLQPVRSLAIDQSGLLWAGTDDGPYLLQTDHPDGGAWVRHPDWKTHPQWENVKLHHLLALPNTAIAATDQGVSRLAFEPQTEEISMPILPINQEPISAGQLDLSATVSEPATNWYWASHLDGPLCTTATVCKLPISRLQPGQHRITLQVQDQTGQWSSLVEVANLEIHSLYLPIILR